VSLSLLLDANSLRPQIVIAVIPSPAALAPRLSAVFTTAMELREWALALALPTKLHCSMLVVASDN
jgi:hypothetical protein